jgi:uncharacterized protein (TIGR03000 family)
MALLGFVSGVTAQHGGGGHGGGGHGGGGHSAGAGAGGAHGSYGGHSSYSGHPGGGYGGHPGSSYGGHSGYYGGHNGQGHDGHGHDGHFDHHHGSYFAFYGFFGPWYPYTYWYGAPYRDWYDWDGGYYGAPVEPDVPSYPPPPPQPAAARDPDKALVVVIVPDPDAQVSIDGEPTQQKGTERIFYSPALESGEKFHYTVRATWSDNGRESTKEMNVTVRAGYRTVVNFIAEPANAKKMPDNTARK